MKSHSHSPPIQYYVGLDVPRDTISASVYDADHRRFCEERTFCAHSPTELTRFENSPTVDSLLAAAPHFIVNTDIQTEEWVANVELGLVKDPLVLGRPNGIIAIADSFYISDSQANGIFVVDRNGYLVRKIGKRGEGPGEFLSMGGLDYNGTHVFVKDRGRVQVFKESMDYASSFSIRSFTWIYTFGMPRS